MPKLYSDSGEKINMTGRRSLVNYISSPTNISKFTFSSFLRENNIHIISIDNERQLMKTHTIFFSFHSNMNLIVFYF